MEEPEEERTTGTRLGDHAAALALLAERTRASEDFLVKRQEDLGWPDTDPAAGYLRQLIEAAKAVLGG
jgi:hypothetical protein